MSNEQNLDEDVVFTFTPQFRDFLITRGASCTTTYANSNSGTQVPTGVTWTANPNPVNGTYLWAKLVFEWVDDTSTTTYIVSYIGRDGSIIEINGKTADNQGKTVIYATDIKMASNDITNVHDLIDLISTRIQFVANDAVSDAEITELFNEIFPQ